MHTIFETRLSLSRISLLVCILMLALLSYTLSSPALAQSAEYQQMIEDSKAETEGLLIYSVMSDRNWEPVIKAFNAKYPWITVTTTDTDAFNVFVGYQSEVELEQRTADMLISTAIDQWVTMIDEQEIISYTSPEEPNLPDFAKAIPSIYLVSTDPTLIIWNKKLVTNPLTSMADLEKLIDSDPAAFTDALTTYHAGKNTTGFNIFWFWLSQKTDSGWQTMEKLGKTNVVLELSASAMVDRVLTEKSKVGFFVSAISVMPRFPKEEATLGWSTIKDGMPVISRYMGVTKHAASPNSAKLMLDFILSPEGQIAFSEGGLTAYRPDVLGKAKLHLATFKAEVGEDNLIFFHPDENIEDEDKLIEFVERWMAIFDTAPVQ